MTDQDRDLEEFLKQNLCENLSREARPDSFSIPYENVRDKLIRMYKREKSERERLGLRYGRWDGPKG